MIAGCLLPCVPKIPSTLRDQAIFVDHATDASLSSYAVLPENEPVVVAVSAGQR
jgi:hypothetical protein